MAGNVAVRHYKTSDLISRFAKLAQTSQYYVLIAADSTKEISRSQRNRNQQIFQFDRNFVREDLGMYCNEASLPGNSFATTEMTTDFPGVSQKFPYRKIYNDLQLTFYVDSSYSVIKFFEDWMSYIASPYGSGRAIAEEFGHSSFKFNYPDYYKCNIFVAKFNKDQSLNNKIAYRFVNAFPIDITSMPVSYDSSDVLRCSVSFSYDRYIFDKTGRLVSTMAPFSPAARAGGTPGGIPPGFGGPFDRRGYDLSSSESLGQGIFGGQLSSSVGFPPPTGQSSTAEFPNGYPSLPSLVRGR